MSNVGAKRISNTHSLLREVKADLALKHQYRTYYLSLRMKHVMRYFLFAILQKLLCSKQCSLWIVEILFSTRSHLSRNEVYKFL